TSKSDADIAAKGDRSWTQYRLEKMRQVSREIVMGPAHAVNPRVKMIIKYPNWYEHFHGLGYDLEQQPRMFDAIYTGTETRDPVVGRNADVVRLERHRPRAPERRLGHRGQCLAGHRRRRAWRARQADRHCKLSPSARERRGFPPQLSRQSRYPDRDLSGLSVK